MLLYEKQCENNQCNISQLFMYSFTCFPFNLFIRDIQGLLQDGVAISWSCDEVPLLKCGKVEGNILMQDTDLSTIRLRGPQCETMFPGVLKSNWLL